MGPARIQFTSSSQRGKKEGWKCKVRNAECRMPNGTGKCRDAPGGQAEVAVAILFWHLFGCSKAEGRGFGRARRHIKK